MHRQRACSQSCVAVLVCGVDRHACDDKRLDGIEAVVPCSHLDAVFYLCSRFCDNGRGGSHGCAGPAWDEENYTTTQEGREDC